MVSCSGVSGQGMVPHAGGGAPAAIARKVLVLTVVVLLMAGGGCAVRAPIPEGLADPDNPLKRIAVLPMRNDTGDVEGPRIVREKMVGALIRRSYRVMDVNESDRILRDRLGINLGGQLELSTPQKLGEVLGVEGVLYGTLMDFDETTTGAYNVRKVRASFRLVNTSSGRAEWSRGLGVLSEQRMRGAGGGIAAVLGRAGDARDGEAPWVTIEHIAAGDTYKESLVIGLGTRLLTTVLGIHLEREADALARMVTDDLRWGPGNAGSGDALDSRR